MWSGSRLSHDSFFNFDTQNHISGTTKATVAKFCMQVEYINAWWLSISDYSLMGVVRVTWLVFLFCPNHNYLWNWWSYALQISCADWYICVLVHAWYITPKGMCDVSRGLLKFWETTDNISLMVQDRELQWKNNKKSYAAYRMAPLPMPHKWP